MATARLRIFVVDAFSAGPLGSGNPAAVVLLPHGTRLSDERQQAIAAEMNLSETAFLELLPGQTPAAPAAAAAAAAAPAAAAGAGENTWESDAGADLSQCDTLGLRWFTPTAEVPLCGHATLAAAAVLFSERLRHAAPVLHFETLSGRLSVRRLPDGSVQMSLPACSLGDPLPPSLAAQGEQQAGGSLSPGLLRLLEPCLQSLAPGGGGQPSAAWLPGMVASVGFAARLRYLLVVLQPAACSPAQLASLQPDIGRMAAAVPSSELGGLIVSVAHPPGECHDFSSRFFGPWLGVGEDPVTGSAHCVLAPWWSAALGGRQQLRGRQCSRRGGDVACDLAGEPGRVLVSGPAKVVLRGELDLS